jgi:hypothetical protein
MTREEFFNAGEIDEHGVWRISHIKFAKFLGITPDELAAMIEQHSKQLERYGPIKQTITIDPEPEEGR